METMVFWDICYTWELNEVLRDEVEEGDSTHYIRGVIREQDQLIMREVTTL